MALPKKEEEESPKTLSATDIPKVHCVPESALEERAPSFWDGESTTPIATSGGHRGHPQPTKASRPKVASSQLSQMIPIKPPASPLRTPTPPKPSSPAKALVLV